MKLIIAIALLLLMWATIPPSHAITPEQMASKGPITLCYVSRWDGGEIAQVMQVHYGPPKYSEFSQSWSRAVRGDYQPLYDPSITSPISGAASTYLNTATGNPETRMFILQFSGTPGVETNMVYFNAQTGQPDAWEQIPCPSSAKKRASTAFRANPAIGFGKVHAR